MEPIALSIPEAAEQLAISADHCRNLVRAGKLPHVKLGGRIVIPVLALREFINEQVVLAAAIAPEAVA